MASAALKDAYSFLRWRLVPVRKLGKLKNRFSGHEAPGVYEELGGMDASRLSEINTDGWTVAPTPKEQTLRAITDLYMPRGDEVVPNDAGHPFENVVRPDDFNVDNPLFRFAFSPQILGAASAYFGGEFSMASIQVMRSFPTTGDLRESQHWHRDYGDKKSLHFIMYLSDVTSEEHGPFAFVNKQVSKRVKSSPVIRRLTDAEIAAEIGTSEYETFYGKAGQAIWVDPAACYHFGSRCRVPRTAVFITFNTHVPYTEMMEPLGSHRARAAEAAKEVRPDLPEGYIDRVLQV